LQPFFYSWKIPRLEKGGSIGLPRRYSRQIVFDGIGEEGQARLLRSRVAIIGLGATGTVAANNLCRAGVGFIRLIDRDYVELTNLQRQTLYDEKDASNTTPKAAAAFNRQPPETPNSALLPSTKCSFISM
jgi:molybdopterin/thiamine biosynthesis adenylyltransferase